MQIENKKDHYSVVAGYENKYRSEGMKISTNPFPSHLPIYHLRVTQNNIKVL
jgi:hypothetical protein